MTAQANDLAPLTDADFNNIRSTIYSPDFAATLEVGVSSQLLSSIRRMSLWSSRIVPMRSFAITTRTISLVSICSPPASIFGISVNRFVISWWITFDRTIRSPCASLTRSFEILRIRMIQKISLQWSRERELSISLQTMHAFETHWSKFSTELSILKGIRKCGVDRMNSILGRRFHFPANSPFPIWCRDFSMSNRKPGRKRSNRSKQVRHRSLRFVNLHFIELVFPAEYYSNITMRLSNTRSIPNSTSVWWEFSENRTGFRISPSCMSTRGNLIIISLGLLQVHRPVTIIWTWFSSTIKSLLPISLFSLVMGTYWP